MVLELKIEIERMINYDEAFLVIALKNSSNELEHVLVQKMKMKLKKMMTINA